MSNVREEVQKGAFVNFLGILGKIAGPSYLVLINRYYGTDLFGIYVTANLTIEIALAFLTSGFKAGALIYVSKHADHPDEKPLLYRALANAIVWSVGLALVLMILGYLLGRPVIDMVYHDAFGDQLLYMSLTMVLVLPFMAFERMVTSATQGLKIMKYEAMVNGGIRPVLLLIFSLSFWYIWPNLTGLAMGYVATQTAVTLFTVYVYNRELEWKPLFSAIAHFKFHKELLDFALPQNLNMTLNKFITGIDVLMLPAFGASATMVGFYGAGSMIVREIRNVKLIFSSAFAPHIVRFHKKNDIKGLSENFSMTANWIATIAIPILIIVAIFRLDLLQIIQPDFSGSTLYMLFLLPVPYFYCSFSLAGNIVTMTGHSKISLMNSLVVASSNFLLNLLLIPKFGLEGAAAASAAAMMILSMLELGEARYFVGAKLLLRNVFRPHLAGAITVAFFLLIEPYLTFFEVGFYNRLVEALVSLSLFAVLLLSTNYNLQGLKKRVARLVG
jgi:O-antigen/teichoic acid export membrane protein